MDSSDNDICHCAAYFSSLLLGISSTLYLQKRLGEKRAFYLPYSSLSFVVSHFVHLQPKPWKF